MPPRPLYRWKSFWLGLLVLAFLGWAWTRSVRQTDSIAHSAKSSSLSWEVESFSGALTFRSLNNPFQSGDGEFYVFSQLNSSSPFEVESWRSRPFVFRQDGDFVETAITHWFLILLFLVPWAGFLLWRVRRVKQGNIEALKPGAER